MRWWYSSRSSSRGEKQHKSTLTTCPSPGKHFYVHRETGTIQRMPADLFHPKVDGVWGIIRGESSLESSLAVSPYFWVVGMSEKDREIILKRYSFAAFVCGPIRNMDPVVSGGKTSARMRVGWPPMASEWVRTRDEGQFLVELIFTARDFLVVKCRQSPLDHWNSKFYKRTLVLDFWKDRG